MFEAYTRYGPLDEEQDQHQLGALGSPCCQEQIGKFPRRQFRSLTACVVRAMEPMRFHKVVAGMKATPKALLEPLQGLVDASRCCRSTTANRFEELCHLQGRWKPLA